MEGNQLKYWLAFSNLDRITANRFKRILYFFKNDLKSAWNADKKELISAKLEENIVSEIISQRQTINPEQELEKLEQEKLQVITIIDSGYPLLLKEIYDAPPLLYYQGDLCACRQNTLAIVGSRKYSSYGQQAVADLAGQLTQAGLTIVSGLALGIDALAHEACLKNNGLTVGVLGSGVDRQSIYPAANRRLADEIINNGGCLLSEYPIGTWPTRYTFPQRNRIIAGLSLGTLVIEAAESSGALITAKCALEYNREVLALPGSIYNEASIGCNNLLKQGAKPVLCAADVLEELQLKLLPKTATLPLPDPLSPEEATIINNLSHEPVHVDKLIKLCNIKINALTATLTFLEIKNKIKNIGGQNYILLKSN